MQYPCPKCKTVFEVTKDCIQSVLKDNILIACPKCKAAGIQVKVISWKEIPSPDEVRRSIVPGWLLCVFSGVGKTPGFYPLKRGKNVIGRTSAQMTVDIALPTNDLGMSRRHAEIEVMEGKRGDTKSVLRNLTGNNLIYVNGKFSNPVKGQTSIELEDRSVILLGEHSNSIQDKLILLVNKPEYAGLPPQAAYRDEKDDDVTREI